MTVDITILQAQGKCSTKEERIAIKCVFMGVGREMHVSFGLHYYEFSTQKGCVILPLLLQFVAITHTPYSQYTVLYNRSH